MKREDYQQLKKIFHATLELPEDERIAFLDAKCPANSPVRDEVLDLLRFYDSKFLFTPVGDVFSSVGFKCGQFVGGYKILQKLGEGGMGIVYEAEQQHPKRLVALKVMRTGYHSDQNNIRLFEREIQALARLRHPGIAAIFDAGTSQDGQLFFVMELVRGTALLDFVRTRCESKDQTHFDSDDILKLFRNICDVVIYAHQSGIIHRDLKPDNILITMDSQSEISDQPAEPALGVKILDFGLARITEPDATATLDLSQGGVIRGTLQYMSPEQVRGGSNEIDTRTDVYSLGVILYEILYGCPPYDVRNVSVIEALRIICDERPKNNTSSTEISTPTNGFSRSISRDVETIVLKALEKEPDRRYQSVAAFADDIERYLNRQPILAHPPSAAYQMRKFVARHRVATASVLLVFMMLLGFGIAMASQSARLASERDRAIQAEQVATQQTIIVAHAQDNEKAQRVLAEDNLNRANEQESIAKHQELLATQARLAAEENLVRAEEGEQQAEEQKSVAQNQKAVAEQQTALAQERADQNARLLYVSQINRAQQAWRDANVSEVEEILAEQIPKPGQIDLRGFEWYYLWRLSHRNEIKFSGPEELYTLAFSPDGTVLAVGGSDSDSQISTTLIDVATGRKNDSIKGRIAVGFATDGRIIALNNWNKKEGSVELWNRETRESSPSRVIVNTFLQPFLSADGSLLATQNLTSKDVEIYDLSTGDKVLSRKNSILATFQMAAFSPDNSLVATTDFGRATVLDVKTQSEQLTVNTEGVAFAVAFSPDNRMLAVGHRSNLEIWDIASKKLVGSVNTSVRTSDNFVDLGLVESLAFTETGRILAAGIGRTVRLFEIPSMKNVLTIVGHGDGIKSVRFSPDGKSLATLSRDRSVKLWAIPDIDNKIEVGRRFGDFVDIENEFGAAFSSNGTLATTSREGRFLIRDPSNLGKITRFDPMDGVKGEYWAYPKYSSNGAVLASYLIPAHSWPAINKKPWPLAIWSLATQKRLGTFKNVSDFDFSANREVLLVSLDGRVDVLEIPSLKTLFTTDGFKTANCAVALSPDASKAALVEDGLLRIIDLHTNRIQQLRIRSLGKSLRQAVAFAPDGNVLAVSAGRNIALLDSTTEMELMTLRGHSSPVSSLAFSNDGRRLASADSAANDGKTLLWDLTTGQAVLSFWSRGTDTVSFASNGSVLVTSGYRGTAVRDGTPLAVGQVPR